MLPSEECVERHGVDAFDAIFDLCSKPVYKLTSDTCEGDSGSGLVYRDNITNCPVIIGIVSSSETLPGCGLPK